MTPVSQIIAVTRVESIQRARRRPCFFRCFIARSQIRNSCASLAHREFTPALRAHRWCSNASNELELHCLCAPIHFLASPRVASARRHSDDEKEFFGIPACADQIRAAVIICRRCATHNLSRSRRRAIGICSRSRRISPAIRNLLRINYGRFPGVGMRFDQSLIGLLAWAVLFVGADAAPQKAVLRERRLDHAMAAGGARSTASLRLDRRRIPGDRVPLIHQPALRARPHQRRRQRLEAHSSLRQRLGARVDSAALLSPGPRRCGRTGVDRESAAQQLLDQHRGRRSRARARTCARSASPCAIPAHASDARDSQGQPVENRSGRRGTRWRRAR